MTRIVRLAPANADLPSLIRFLDQSPAWIRQDTRSSHLVWEPDPELSRVIYGRTRRDTLVLLPPPEVAAHVDVDRWCDEAVTVINAVALRLDPKTPAEAVDRLADIYRAADPGSAIALIASGQVETEEDDK
ncbi:hypothetical protein [Planomonospora algeriensis]